jgi:hypothetical protein
MSDVDEAVAGTDDKDATSFLYLMVERTGTPGERLLTWPSVNARTYQIEGRASLDTGTWNMVIPNVPGTGAMLQALDTDASGRMYYRIGVTGP